MNKKPKLTPWCKGTPPCVGWWNASAYRNPCLRRYWNGEYWSRPVIVGQTDDKQTRIAQAKTDKFDACFIEWRGLAEPPRGKK